MEHFIKKACINLLLKASKSEQGFDNPVNLYRFRGKHNVQIGLKPDFECSIDHLGPVSCKFLGVDEKKGILIADGSHAISCHLKGKAI